MPPAESAKPVVFGQSRLRVWGAAALLHGGWLGFFTYRAFHGDGVSWSPVVPVAVWLAAVLVCWGAGRTVATIEGIRFHNAGHFWQFRSEYVPWTRVVAIEARMREWDGNVVLRLDDGTWRWLRQPSEAGTRRELDDAVAMLSALHGSAVHEKATAAPVPGSIGHMEPDPPVRPWVNWAVAVIMVSAVLLVGVWIGRKAQATANVADVDACAVLPREVADRVMPGGEPVSGSPDRRRCLWRTGRIGFELAVRSENARSVAESYDLLRDRHRARYAVHRLPGGGHTLTRGDPGGPVAEGWIPAGGHLVGVVLRPVPGWPAGQAERYAGELVRGVADRLADR